MSTPQPQIDVRDLVARLRACMTTITVDAANALDAQQRQIEALTRELQEALKALGEALPMLVGHEFNMRNSPDSDAMNRAHAVDVRKQIDQIGAILRAEAERTQTVTACAECERLKAERPGDTKLTTDRERQCHTMGFDRGVSETFAGRDRDLEKAEADLATAQAAQAAAEARERALREALRAVQQMFGPRAHRYGCDCDGRYSPSHPSCRDVQAAVDAALLASPPPARKEPT